MARAPVTVGLIGLGRMGQHHLRVLSMLNGVELGFVYDVDADTARRAAATYQAPVTDDLETGLRTVDAVIVCSPTPNHAEHVRLAAAQVQNVFVEKPLAHTLEAAEGLAQLAAQRGLNLQVGFIERFNPAVQQLKSILERSERVVSVDLTRTNRLSARITDVDVVIDLMIHDLDLALYLNGPIRSLFANGVGSKGMIDLASVVLTHENGRFSRVLASRITEKKIRAIHATCMDMFVDCDLLRKEIVITRQSEIGQPRGESYTITAIEETVAVIPQEALLMEMQAFIRSCRGETVAGLPGTRDGIAAQTLCERIREAIPS